MTILDHSVVLGKSKVGEDIGENEGDSETGLEESSEMLNDQEFSQHAMVLESIVK